jgi:hypothetical protein
MKSYTETAAVKQPAGRGTDGKPILNLNFSLEPSVRASACAIFFLSSNLTL